MKFVSGARDPVPRLCAAAFLADFALYLVMTGAPYQALRLGGGPIVLGLIPVARSLPYTLATVWAGGLSENRERLRAARTSVLVAAGMAAALAWGAGFFLLFAGLAVLGVALAFFWPALQATLGDLESRSGRSAEHLGWFNIAWSLGKSSGFALGGLVLAGPGFPALFLSAGAALLGVALVLRLTRVPRTAAEAPDQTARVPVAPAVRHAAWLANATAFGVATTLNTHYPGWLAHQGHGETLFGTFLGLVFLCQTVTFAVMARRRGWTRRAGPMLLAQVPLAIALFALPVLPEPRLILLAAPLAGMGMGVTYFASLFHSMQSATRGRHAGVHEAALGLGAIVLPILGGLAVRITGRLDSPFLVAGAACVVALALQIALLSGAGPGRTAQEQAGAPEGRHSMKPSGPDREGEGGARCNVSERGLASARV